VYKEARLAAKPALETAHPCVQPLSPRQP
jgi:hypothetical protein